MVAEDARTSRMGEKEDEEYHKEDEDVNEEWKKERSQDRPTTTKSPSTKWRE